MAAAARPGRASNICCVGDDDQSIYGWRGAEVDNILRFENDFPGAKVIRLERNYRSTGHILAAASGLIAHNKGRLGKTLFTDDDARREGRRRPACGTTRRRRALIGEEIEALQRKQACASTDMAILVRASFQMREFEERFITLGLPYRVIGGPRFYERPGDPRRARLSARVTLNPADDLAFERIVNTPKRGLGDADAATRCTATPARAGIPLMQAARRARRDRRAESQAARQALRDLLAALRPLARAARRA